MCLWKRPAKTPPSFWAWRKKCSSFLEHGNGRANQRFVSGPDGFWYSGRHLKWNKKTAKKHCWCFNTRVCVCLYVRVFVKLWTYPPDCGVLTRPPRWCCDPCFPQHNTDTGGADHSCSICGKSLSSASSLDRHMLVHSGERPYKCTVCGQSFTTNGNMHRWVRVARVRSLEPAGGWPKAEWPSGRLAQRQQEGRSCVEKPALVLSACLYRLHCVRGVCSWEPAIPRLGLWLMGASSGWPSASRSVFAEIRRWAADQTQRNPRGLA